MRDAHGWRAGLTLIAALLVTAPAAGAATIRVTTTGDPVGPSDCTTTDTACSLRQAVNAAHNGDRVMVPRGTYKLIQPAPNALTISASITLAGAGARHTIIRQTVSEPVLTVGNGATVVIQGVTITGGKAVNTGGGIFNQGTLTLRSSAVTDNEADGYVGQNSFSYPGYGGGIYSQGSLLRIVRSTISGNLAAAASGNGGYGGGVYSVGPVAVVNSTIAGNVARGGKSNTGFGGGIYDSQSSLTLANATIAFNRAVGMSGVGGNVYLYFGSTSAVKNSLIARGQADAGSQNCGPVQLTSQGYNLEDRHQCGLTAGGDRHPVNAQVGLLGNHGGPTNTVGLLSGSLAINGGYPSGCPDPLGVGTKLGIDQRGIHRPQGVRCDIGAFEFRVVKLSGKPKVSGQAHVGKKLTCVPPAIQSPDGPVTNVFRWLRSGKPVAGGRTYVIRAVDRGHTLACRLRAANAAGSASATSPAVSVS